MSEKRYIDANALYEMARTNPNYKDFCRSQADLTSLRELLDEYPAADVEPVVRGEWIEHDDECECPVCGETWNYCDNDTERFDCCPKCGARLVEHGKERER